MTDHENMTFEPGDTMVEFTRVVAENAFRRGFVIGFCAGGVYETPTNRRSDILRLRQVAVRATPTLDVKWTTEEADDEDEPVHMLVVDENEDGSLPLIGVSARSYRALDQITLTPEE